jgi:cell division protein FtsL
VFYFIANKKRYLELVRAISGLTQDLNIGSTDESNVLRNVERVRAEIKKLSEKTVKDRQVLETSLEKSGKVVVLVHVMFVLFAFTHLLTQQDKQALETTFRMSETVATGLRKEIADLRESKRALESELQSSKKENEVLRDSSHRVADTTKAASQVNNNDRKGCCL